MVLCWPLISRTSDSRALWYHLLSEILIKCHLSSEMVLVGGATGQVLLLLKPSLHQRIGDWCSADQRLTWSSTWTCCSRLCTSSLSELAGSCSSSWLCCNLKLQFKLKHHTGTVWQWAWSLSLTDTAQVGHLVIASWSVRSPGPGSQESWQGNWSHSVSLSDWQQQAQLHHGSC